MRYNEDGTIHYLGRKDAQIKVRGQRVELAEIEHQLGTDAHVESGLVLFPKSGLLADKVTAVLSLTEGHGQDHHEEDDDADGMEEDEGLTTTTKHGISMVQGKRLVEGRVYLRALRQALANSLPSLMVPTVWLVVRHIPMNASGKLDRVRTMQWAAELDRRWHEQQHYCSSQRMTKTI